MKIGLKIGFELEGSEDVTAEVMQAAEISTASFIEQLEGLWAQNLEEVRKRFPGLKVTASFDNEDEE